MGAAEGDPPLAEGTLRGGGRRPGELPLLAAGEAPRGIADPSSRPLPAGGRFLRAPGLGAAARCEGRAPPGRLIEVMAGGCSPVNPARGQLAPLRLAAGIQAGCEGDTRRPPALSRGRRGSEKLGGTVCVCGGDNSLGKGGCEVSRYLTRGRGRFLLPEAAPWQAHKGARIASISPGHGHGVNPVRNSAFLFLYSPVRAAAFFSLSTKFFLLSLLPSRPSQFYDSLK